MPDVLTIEKKLITVGEASGSAYTDETIEINYPSIFKDSVEAKDITLSDGWHEGTINTSKAAAGQGNYRAGNIPAAGLYYRLEGNNHVFVAANLQFTPVTTTAGVLLGSIPSEYAPKYPTVQICYGSTASTDTAYSELRFVKIKINTDGSIYCMRSIKPGSYETTSKVLRSNIFVEYWI